MAGLHAAARSETVFIQHEDGRRSVYRRGGHSPVVFLFRLMALQMPDGERATPLTAPASGFFLYHEQPMPPGSQVVALRATVREEPGVEHRSFAQVIGDLSPVAGAIQEVRIDAC